MLCEYKEIFGKPNEGFHKKRIFGLAFWDLFGTFIIIIVLSYYFAFDILCTTMYVFAFTIFIHKLFCVDTTLNKKIFS
jgi:hypothetical protein